MTDDPLTTEAAPLPRLLATALDGLECGAPEAEHDAALALLGWEPATIGARPPKAFEERLFCACWNALYELGLRPDRLDPELPEAEPEQERRLQPGDLVPERHRDADHAPMAPRREGEPA